MIELQSELTILEVLYGGLVRPTASIECLWQA